MARKFHERDISAILAAAQQWLDACLTRDGAMFIEDLRWTPELLNEVHRAFVEHPDTGEDDFMTKLKGQMKNASAPAQQLMAEMLWALLLFPSNMKAKTKRQQIREIWAFSGQQLAEDHRLLRDDVLVGVGSGGMAFLIKRPEEMAFLIVLTRDLKRRTEEERRGILSNYDAFIAWIGSVPQHGNRQFRHMLRFFAFPDRVERMSSNNDRQTILEAFKIATRHETISWSDKQLDDALMALRTKLQATHPSEVLDFYEPPLRELWSRDRKIKTLQGEVTITVPGDDEESEDKDLVADTTRSPEARQSIQVQSKLAEIGAMMGLKVWIPRANRVASVDSWQKENVPRYSKTFL